MTEQMAEIRFPLRGRRARRGEPTSPTTDPLQQMAAQIHDLDQAAKRVAEGIQDVAASLGQEAATRSATRTDLLAGLASALVDRAEEIRSDCGRLSALMERTAKLIAEHDSREGAEPPAGSTAEPPPPPEPEPEPEQPPIAPTPNAGGTSEGVRLIATQMAIAGSSRAEIERRLRIQFGVRDADRILDDIFGDQRSEVGG